MLLGRSLEVEYLRQYYEKEGSSLIVMYGQKNVGKTALLKSFCEKIPYHYYLARPCSERQQKYFWANQIRAEYPQLKEFPTFSEILHTLSSPHKKVIILDEFQSFIKVNTTFMNDLIAFLHTTENDVLVILCSSQVGFVENNLIPKIGSNAYDIHGFFKIKQLSFQNLTDFFPNRSTKEAITLFSVFGCLPGIWSYLSKESSIKENICDFLLAKDSVILTDTLGNIEDQLRETNVYYTILSAMADGNEKLNELYSHTGFSRAKISVYLKNLMEHELVEKVFSFDTDGRENAKKGIYRITNHLVYFYFKFLYPHLSELYLQEPEFFYEEFIAPKMDDYVAEMFPSICREYLELMNQNGQLPISAVSFGEWVGKVGTIPVVAKSERGHCLSAYCHWKKEPMPYADYEWLLFCIQQAKLSDDYIYLFSVSGFDTAISQEAKQKKNLILIDMY